MAGAKEEGAAAAVVLAAAVAAEKAEAAAAAVVLAATVAAERAEFVEQAAVAAAAVAAAGALNLAALTVSWLFSNLNRLSPLSDQDKAILPWQILSNQTPVNIILHHLSKLSSTRCLCRLCCNPGTTLSHIFL